MNGEQDVTKEFEKLQKQKVREFQRRKTLFNGYCHFLGLLVQGSDKYTTAREICERAYNLAKSAELIWLENCPEDEADFVNMPFQMG